MPVKRPHAPLETSNENVPGPTPGGWSGFAPMSSWIKDANAGSLTILSWYTPALTSKSSSSAVRFARSRHERAAASASFNAPGANGRGCALAVALASMIVPIAPHQLIDLKDHDPDLEPRSQSEEQDSVFLVKAALPQVLPQRDEMRRRRRVAKLINGHDHVLGRHPQVLRNGLHSLLDRPGRRLVGDQIVDLVEVKPGLIERLAQQRRQGLDCDILEPPGIAVHRLPAPDLGRIGQTHATVLGQRRKPSDLDPGSSLGRPLQDRRGAGVPERQRRELLAHNCADLTRGIETQL